MGSRHGVPDTHIWNPATGRYLAEGSDPGALLKRPGDPEADRARAREVSRALRAIEARHSAPVAAPPTEPARAVEPVRPAVEVKPPATLLALCSTENTDDLGRPNGAGTQCAGRGNLPRCQLCPSSPTYWRTTAPASAADPWGNDGESTLEYAPLPERFELNWGKNSKAYFEWGRLRSCILCGKDTELRSPKGEPCHKTCAEDWHHAVREGARPPSIRPR